MSVSLRVTGYDKLTEALVLEHPVPESAVSEAQSLAHVDLSDDGWGSYPLEPKAAVKLGVRMDWTLDVDAYDWFLEPG